MGNPASQAPPKASVMKYCMICGKQILFDMNFCGYCGQSQLRESQIMLDVDEKLIWPKRILTAIISFIVGFIAYWVLGSVRCR
jgi:predicted transcriptional regulator